MLKLYELSQLSQLKNPGQREVLTEEKCYSTNHGVIQYIRFCHYISDSKESYLTFRIKSSWDHQPHAERVHALTASVDGRAHRGLLDDHPLRLHHGADHAAHAALLCAKLHVRLLRPHDLPPKGPQLPLEDLCQDLWRLSYQRYVVLYESLSSIADVQCLQVTLEMLLELNIIS